MDVTAYNYNGSDRIDLGKIADSIWTGGFRFSQTRTIQINRPINAAAPNLFDRFTKLVDFEVACGRAFNNVGDALIFMARIPTPCRPSRTSSSLKGSKISGCVMRHQPAFRWSPNPARLSSSVTA
jgi:hypothetical protein